MSYFSNDGRHTKGWPGLLRVSMVFYFLCWIVPVAYDFIIRSGGDNNKYMFDAYPYLFPLQLSVVSSFLAGKFWGDESSLVALIIYSFLLIPASFILGSTWIGSKI